MPARLSSPGPKIAEWLRQGMSPRRLALTLALGFAVGCIPVVGLPTLLCLALAFALRLNLPAIQVANYLAMPLQLLLIVPFVRLGELLFAASGKAPLPASAFPLEPLSLLAHFGTIAAHALLAWLLVAGPAVALMTGALTLVLRQLPISSREAA
jgi:uncharacterized protein (DUF2062 family)